LEELGGRPARAADEQHQEKRPTGRGLHHVDVAPKLEEGKTRVKTVAEFGRSRQVRNAVEGSVNGAFGVSAASFV
jgi:hypothetical protein